MKTMMHLLTMPGTCARRLRGLLNLSLLLLFFGSPLLAQNSLGSVQGTVSDKSGGVIPSAEVIVYRADTGVRLTVNTNGEGYYTVTSLVPGNYTITFKMKGFADLEVTGVQIEPSQDAVVNGVLEVASAKGETIVVHAADQMLSPESATVSTTMDANLTQNLPYAEQGSLDAALLAPGVTASQVDGGRVSTENPGIYIGQVSPGASISINGAPAGHSAIMVDGSDVTQTSFSRAGITVSGGMVGQVTVISNGVPAQYGRTMGGVIISTTKSGTNEYHGQVTWRHTDPIMQAQPDGQVVPPDLHQNFFGAFLGGPVVIPHLYNGHDKTFFFVGFEPARMRNDTTNPGVLFSPAMVAGHYKDALRLLNTTILETQGIGAALAAPRVGHLWYQEIPNSQGFPSGAQLASGSNYLQVGAVTSNNPAGLPCNSGELDDLSCLLPLNPVANYIHSILPTDTNPQEVRFRTASNGMVGMWDGAAGYNADIIRGVSNTDNRVAIRMDQVFGNSDRMYARYSRTPVVANRFGPFALDSPYASFPSDEALSNNVILDETHIFSRGIINEIKVGWLRNDQRRTETAAALSKDWGGAMGLVPAVSGKGFPTFSFSGYNDDPGSYASRVVDATSQLQDDVTIILGLHTLRFGVDIRRLQTNQIGVQGTNGVNGGVYGSNFESTQNGGGGEPLASFDLGLLSSFTNTPNAVNYYYRYHYYAGYVQDDWRIRNNVTLNIGMRYELETPRMEKFNNQGTFLPNPEGSLNGIPATGAFCFSGSCGLHKTIWPMNYHGFEPRAGISWVVAPRVVVRASYALLRVPLTGLSNTPFPNINVNSNTVGGDFGGVAAGIPVNYITNPIAASEIPVFAQLKGFGGPFYSAPSAMTVPYIRQWNAVPYSQQWSFTTQFQPFSKTLVEVGYNGARSIHTFSNDGITLNNPGLSTVKNLISQHGNFGNSQLVPNPYGLKQNGVVITEELMQTLYPYQSFFDQQLQEQLGRFGDAYYHGGFVSLSQRMNAGLSAQFSFTYSKSIDDTGVDSAGANAIGSSGALQNPRNLRGERSYSDADIPVKISAGYVYDLPLGTKRRFFFPLNTGHEMENLVDRVGEFLFGDWTTGGIFKFQTAYPLRPILGGQGYWFSYSLNPTSTATSPCALTSTSTVITAVGTICSVSSALPAGYNLRPNIVPGVPLKNPLWKQDKFNQPYYNLAAFSVPGAVNSPADIQGTPSFGNAPRTMGNARGPHLIMFDVNVSKRFPVGTSGQKFFQIQALLFNAFNHPVFQPGAGSGFFQAFSSTANCSVISTTSAQTCTGGFLPQTGSSLTGEVNSSFTAQFSRYVQIAASFNF